eukprot:Filipodium_phascolosomae@DN7067_c0_g1_i1.p1
MSVNPLLSRNDTRFPGESAPAYLPGEALLMRRKHLHLTLTFDTPTAGGPKRQKITEDGNLYVTTLRMVFVAGDRTRRPDFTSLGIPLKNILRHDFKQPVFGANYLH